MEQLNLIKQVVQLAFASGKITNLDEIKKITEAFDLIQNILYNHYTNKD